MERWRLLRTWDGEPGYNMALDEALLLLGGATPCLRFYTWRPAALSLGYFQRFDDVPGAATAAAVVRRRTGGGAIHHAHELTFAIACPAEHPLYRGAVRASYERVHALLAEALASFGAAAAPRGARGLASDRADTGMCFHRSTDVDLAWDGRKGVGSAQRRTHGRDGSARVLHHGSIKLGETELEHGVAGLPRTHAAELAAAVARVFAHRVPCTLEPAEPKPAEERHARARAAAYTAKAFVRRR